MKIESRPGGKDIEAWQPVESLQVERLARELTQQVYHLTKKPGFTKDYGLKGQIQDAAGSSMHNIQRDSIPRRMRSLSGSCDMPSALARKSRPARHRSRSGEAGGANSMSPWMKSTYRPTNSKMFTRRRDESRNSGIAVRGFINYSFDLEALDRLKKYEEHKQTNREPLAQT